MIKLIRDSLFNPKNIIHYRAKKTWFVILYVLVVALVYAFSMASTPLSYDGLNYTEKIELRNKLALCGSSFTDGKYDSLASFDIETSGITIAFLKSSEDVKTYLSSNTVDFIVINSDVKIVNQSAYSTNYFKILDFEKIIVNLDSKVESGTNIYDAFVECVNETLVSLKPLAVLIFFAMGLISGAITILFYALLSFLFLNISLRASRYMKKDQLFRMMIFSSTGIVIAESLIYLFSLTGIISFVILLAGFVPTYILEREFMRRIRIKQFGESVMDNESVIDKINEMLNKEKNENEDDNNNDKGE